MIKIEMDLETIGNNFLKTIKMDKTLTYNNVVIWVGENNSNRVFIQVNNYGTISHYNVMINKDTLDILWYEKIILSR